GSRFKGRRRVLPPSKSRAGLGRRSVCAPLVQVAIDSLFEGGAMASIDPTIAVNAWRSGMPGRNATHGDTQDAAFALRPRLEPGLPQQTARVVGNFKRPNVEVD